MLAVGILIKAVLASVDSISNGTGYPYKLHIIFSKTGAAVFISHLDLLRVFTRAMRMAEIPVRYTGKFNPHQHLVFPAPLSLGISGLEEHMEIYLEKDMSENEVIDGLNSSLPNGISVLSCEKLPRNLKLKISSACYTGSFRLNNMSYETVSSIRERIAEFFSHSEIIAEKSKYGKNSESEVKRINIIPLIQKYNLEYTDKFGFKLNLQLAAGSESNLNPLLVEEVLKKEKVIPKCSLKWERVKLF